MPTPTPINQLTDRQELERRAHYNSISNQPNPNLQSLRIHYESEITQYEGEHANHELDTAQQNHYDLLHIRLNNVKNVLNGRGELNASVRRTRSSSSTSSSDSDEESLAVGVGDQTRRGRGRG